MKLDDLSPTELECYEEWNSADHSGGDCSIQGYAWAAWDDDRIIITENEQGFVEASTYDADDGSGERAYTRRRDYLLKRDEEFYAQTQEDEERDNAIAEASDNLQELESEERGRCDSCEVSLVTAGAYGANKPVRVHEQGCPRERALKDARTHLERLEDY